MITAHPLVRIDGGLYERELLKSWSPHVVKLPALDWPCAWTDLAHLIALRPQGEVPSLINDSCGCCAGVQPWLDGPVVGAQIG